MDKTNLYGINQKITGDYDKDLAVTCSTGTYVGTKQDGVLSFKGIHYALPPTGKMRWHEPVAVPESEDVFEAKFYGNACQQNPEYTATPVGEDCLTLNIWTDSETLDTKKPVMFWIHGGAYCVEAAGDPLYHGEDFAKAHKDVVLITVEYRLGVSGFLQLDKIGGEEYENSGCLGLLDQIEALKWVKKNIAAFGGDPESVTIFGESAGGGSVSLLSISPLAKGLFKRVIAQSGAVGLSVRRETANNIAQKFLEDNNCKTIDDLLALSEEALQYYVQVAPVFPTEVLPYNNYDELHAAWRDGLGEDVDLMTGTNAQEMSYFIQSFGSRDAFYEREMETNKKRRALVAEKDLPIYDELLKVKEGEDPVEGILRMTGDTIFHLSSFLQAEVHSDANRGKTYVYYCTTPAHFDPAQYGYELGACHAVEVSYVFNNHYEAVSGPNQSQAFADQIQEMWINFAKTGDPSIPGLEWPEFNKENWNVMILDGGEKGGSRIDNAIMKDEVEFARPLASYPIIEAGL